MIPWDFFIFMAVNSTLGAGSELELLIINFAYQTRAAQSLNFWAQSFSTGMPTHHRRILWTLNFLGYYFLMEDTGLLVYRFRPLIYLGSREFFKISVRFGNPFHCSLFTLIQFKTFENFSIIETLISVRTNEWPK